MFTIKSVRTFPLNAFVSEINEFQKRLSWFSSFPGVALLNNCEVSWLPYCFKTKAVCVCENNKGNRSTSQLFKMAAPGKFKSENK